MSKSISQSEPLVWDINAVLDWLWVEPKKEWRSIPMGDPTPQQILDLTLEDNDAGAATVRDYLKKLLSEVWIWGEGFDSKRPFGNSIWQDEVYLALANAGWIHAKFDKDGDLEDIDDMAGDRLIMSAIEAL